MMAWDKVFIIKTALKSLKEILNDEILQKYIMAISTGSV